MKMTKEKAIAQIEKLKSYCEYMGDSDESGAYLFDLDVQALDFALSVLHSITREQVEKMRGEWIDRRALSDAPVECSNCGEWVYGKLQDANFCPLCGVPMTDEAVDMVMERLEALKDGT